MPNTKVVQNKITGKFLFFETNLIKPEKIRPIIDKGIKPPKNIKLKLGYLLHIGNQKLNKKTNKILYINYY